MSVADVRIPSHGETIAAYLFRPDGAGPAPCVVMAHGFSATREDGLVPYAEAFRDAGFAVVLFDYRRFGASSGEPRQVIDIPSETDDYRAVIEWARNAEGIDPDRIVLWGSSFSGGLVVELAADDPRIAAVIAQAPFTDSVATVREMPVRNVLRAGTEAMLDRAGALLGRPPRYIPAVAPAGRFGVMSEPGAQPGFAALVGPESLWRNEVAARIILQVLGFRPVRQAARLAMPVLFCVCDDDAITPPGPTIEAARRAPQGELRRYPYGHFEIYHDPQVKADQVEFLTRVVPGL
jgi:pimeloyl-ACP methyl ester carboxylesterase